jgi:hypothetical protein
VVRELVANYDDGYWWRERIQDRVCAPLLRLRHGTDGIDVPAADWDTLLVYDACRADMFEQTVGTEAFDGYERVVSRGSSSSDWLRMNFAGRSLGDVVCVTANPWTARIAPEAFHDLIDVWQDEQNGEETPLVDRDLATAPDSTVAADRLADAARGAADRYPDKRLLVHFFQPHAPCIGAADGSLKRPAAFDPDLHPGRPLRAGRVDRASVWEAYCENLAYVHHHGSRLATDLGGKTVFTADHGELFGEWLWPVPMRGYAHPERLRHPTLTTVPWATRTVGERRDVRAGETGEYTSDEDAVEERLKNLGYV